MSKEELFEMISTDFVDELVNMYKEGDIKEWSEMKNLALEYAAQNAEDVEFLLELLNQKMDEHI